MQILNYIVGQYHESPRLFVALVVFLLTFMLAVFWRGLGQDYLRSCAEHNSPVRIGGKFYYLVPESIYVRSKLNLPSRSAMPGAGDDPLEERKDS
jgi:hypothetical protein